jgi:hypothetical protein
MDGFDARAAANRDGRDTGQLPEHDGNPAYASRVGISLRGYDGGHGSTLERLPHA